MAVLDINNIKEQVQVALQTENTTTSSIRDLSTGLETRVQAIYKVNPARIPIQGTEYPFVTVYCEMKEIAEQTINKNQASGRRQAELDLKIVGMVWNSTISNVDEDAADDDAESLMENVEEILRNYTTLNGAVSWGFPTTVTYHNVTLEEEAHVRAGVMTYRVKAFY